MEENLKQLQSGIIKIALYGPESTGKTTLAHQLADEFNTLWIPEFARNYLQEKWDFSKEICTQEDLLPIAIGQTKLENEALSKANKHLFCDTNLMVTKVFSEIYYGTCDPKINQAAKEHHYDLFFLTDIDVPWEKDDLRDKPEDRKSTIALFEKALIENNKPYILLSGNKKQRLEKAINIVVDLTKAKQLGFNSFDFIDIYNRNINLETVENQLDILKNGLPKIHLEKPALLNDGIIALRPEDAKRYAAYFDKHKQALQLTKFVPASGAASRMFKFLSEFLSEFKIEEESINAYINRKKDRNLSLFLVAKEKFPFYKDVVAILKAAVAYDSWSVDQREFYFIETLLSSNYFDFENKPKAVLPFHTYKNHVATAIEEHLKECVSYANSNKQSSLHFTVSKEHQESFEEIISVIKPRIELENDLKINVDYSFQDKATDVIAVNLDGNPFREEDNKLVFRPGGHGALIQNLNSLQADIIFIKNIDNVIQNQAEIVTLYKKALAGILVQLQEIIFQNLRLLDATSISNQQIEEIVQFLSTKLNISVTDTFSKFTNADRIEYLKNVLNRPIRVCGMVKNEGEPGGGPFWVTDNNGAVFLQIIEASQVENNQKKIVEKATHFNPVDIVCGTKNYKGEHFDLTKFVDKNTGFIVEKNKNGKALKAYELPGLWNGAMAKWLTIFVEVPLVTFNPVKTVNDLLKPAHQSQD